MNLQNLIMNSKNLITNLKNIIMKEKILKKMCKKDNPNNKRLLATTYL
jgi:hypothetical protein